MAKTLVIQVTLLKMMQFPNSWLAILTHETSLQALERNFLTDSTKLTVLQSTHQCIDLHFTYDLQPSGQVRYKPLRRSCPTTRIQLLAGLVT
jgi:hypothetical protein